MAQELDEKIARQRWQATLELSPGARHWKLLCDLALKIWQWDRVFFNRELLSQGLDEIAHYWPQGLRTARGRLLDHLLGHPASSLGLLARHCHIHTSAQLRAAMQLERLPLPLTALTL
jgi:hypothetical protein